LLRPNPARPNKPTPNRNKEAGSGTENVGNPSLLAKTVGIIINPKIYIISSTATNMFFFTIRILITLIILKATQINLYGILRKE